MKRNIVIAAVTATALIGGGAAVAFADGGDEARSAQRTTVVDTAAGVVADDADRAPASKLTAAQAIEAALKAQPGTVYSADLDDDRDGDDDGDGDDRGWEVDILGSGSTSYTVRVDPATGKVLGTDTDRDEDDAAEARRLLKGADIDAREAAQAAEAKGVVTSVELDDDSGEGWSAETAGSDRDWHVHLRTGKVTADRDDDSVSEED
ncbi:PepSY domain-containing protein [Streptomyces sp. NPDC052610]|uniref:PepSY domain-containing protein n=1 Tax=Streptomyces sp. NPDC052610 TaxID=3154952 RepID=UPI0034373EAB